MNHEERIATAMADSWMGDEVDCADVGSILAPTVDAIAIEAVASGIQTGIEEARRVFNRLWSSGDWEGQVSIGFASTFAEELDRCLE